MIYHKSGISLSTTFKYFFPLPYLVILKFVKKKLSYPWHLQLNPSEWLSFFQLNASSWSIKLKACYSAFYGWALILMMYITFFFSFCTMHLIVFLSFFFCVWFNKLLIRNKKQYILWVKVCDSTNIIQSYMFLNGIDWSNVWQITV